MVVGRRRKGKICLWPWNVKSTIRKAELPQQKPGSRWEDWSLPTTSQLHHFCTTWSLLRTILAPASWWLWFFTGSTQLPFAVEIWGSPLRPCSGFSFAPWAFPKIRYSIGLVVVSIWTSLIIVPLFLGRMARGLLKMGKQSIRKTPPLATTEYAEKVVRLIPGKRGVWGKKPGFLELKA